MEKDNFDDFISLNVKENLWDHFYTVAPLVVIGSKENDEYDLSPKHMVTPIGFSNYIGFVCTPRHRTYHNIKKERKFTVSFVRPSQVLLTSLAAIPRCEENHFTKKIVNIRLKNCPVNRPIPAPHIESEFRQSPHPSRNRTDAPTHSNSAC